MGWSLWELPVGLSDCVGVLESVAVKDCVGRLESVGVDVSI